MCNVLHLIATDTTLIKSNDAGKSKLIISANFRDRRLPSRLHLGPLQPQEEQAAAHRQPEQEDDHLSGMVSAEISTYIYFRLEAEDNSILCEPANPFPQQ